MALPVLTAFALMIELLSRTDGSIVFTAGPKLLSAMLLKSPPATPPPPYRLYVSVLLCASELGRDYFNSKKFCREVSRPAVGGGAIVFNDGYFDIYSYSNA